MKLGLRRVVLCALAGLAAASAYAQDWGNVAVISDTMGDNSGRLCVGDGSRPSDIGCPTYAPSVSTAGHVSITGNVSANKFIGDGSSLTGIASGDRVASGTHVVVVNENTGYVSLTTGGGTWGYLSAGWNFLNSLFANTVSSSLVSATNVSATLVDATRDGTVSGTYGYFRYISGTNIHGTFTGDGSGLTGIASGDRIASGTTPQTQMVAISNTRYISITQGGANTAWFDPTRGLVALGVSTTGPISGTRGYFGGYVTIEEGDAATPASLLISNTVSGTAASARLQLSTQGGSAYIYRTSEGYTPTAVRNSLVFQEYGGGDIVFWTNLGEAMRVTNAKNVGIGLSSPTATFGVSGTISATNAIQVGSSALACSGGIPGALRYNSGSMEYCNGTSWTNLSSSTSAGVTTIASLTDVQLTNTAGRDYLRYDAGASKWVNISESEVMSTTTVLPNWPDAILCSDGTQSYVLRFVRHNTSNNANCYHEALDNARVCFTPAGAYSLHNNLGSYDCISKPISQLYSEGKAFNFIGGIDGDAGSPVEEDRITSGTLAVIGNSATSIVSLSTNGTTWGYLGNAASFLPTLTANKVSSTNISATYVHLNSATAPLTCGGGLAGAIRYAGIGNMEYCDGTGWTSLSSNTSVPISTIASLTDVQLTDLAGRDYLRYDAGASKWVNISESTVMSTTTMAAGWPDAIRCTSSTRGEVVLYLDLAPGTNGKYYYMEPHSGDSQVRFAVYDPDGSFYTQSGLGTMPNCDSDIASIYAAGRAFNFIGSANVAGSSAEGDRITSGTLAVIGNSATSIVSLSTNGTTWGYLGNAASYLPTITANKVSSTNISATYVHLNSATTPLACNSGFTGAMRYTSGTMQVCDGNNWGNIGIGVPGGTIAAFEAVSCPAGWNEYTPARGRFLRGIDTLAAGIDPSGTRAPGNIQEDTLQNLTGSVGNATNGFEGAFDTASGALDFTSGAATHYMVRTVGAGTRNLAITFDASRVARTSTETRPKNVAVIYCQYNGYNTELSTGVATLASLSDVAVGGVATGQVLAFDGSSWVPSNTSSVGLLNDLTDVNTAGAVAGNVIRYNGSSWVVSDATSVAALSSLSDVTLTNLAGRDYLRYDAIASKWVNISESTVMSTTTMVDGWPDAIVCNVTNPVWGPAVGYLTRAPGSTNLYGYAFNSMSTNNLFHAYFNSDGSFNSYQNLTTTDCNKTISQLYADGQAFNFIGGIDGDAGSPVEGDRITSGTLAVVGNSTTSIVSLSTNGTTWGYLGNAASYLPTITANKVSSTNISATYVHLNSATTPLACDVGLTGAIRYSTTSSTLQYCDGSNWSDEDTGSRIFTLCSNENSDGDGNDDKAACVAAAADTGRGGSNFRAISCSGTANGDGTRSGVALRWLGTVWQYYINSWNACDDGTVSVMNLAAISGGSGASVLELNDLADVSASAPVVGDVVRFDGTNWVASTTSAGVSAIASLTDVTLTNLAGRDYLRYDAGASKWVNISESTVMSTTTMVDGWPDAIVCTVTNPNLGGVPFYLSYGPWATNGSYYYRANAETGSVTGLVFNSNGTFNAYQNITTSNCNTSISSLYASGRAFNFIGSANVAGSSAEGDRLTSGTLSVVANSATSIVSLSTNGTTWGYLGNAASFLPTITANKVSSTNISATYVHLNSATTPLTCNAGLAGSMRYTSSGAVQVCNGTTWSATGVSTISSLTDVTLTNLAGRDYLRYDAGSSKWVNISESTVMSTTTMAAGWPDAVLCISGTNELLLYARGRVSTGFQYWDPSSGTTRNLIFTYDDKTYNSNTALAGYDCISKPISQLYSEGKAFNFIGNANVAGSSAEGDRLTSGTLSVVANSNTSVVSLSTAGTTWGYLGNGVSYLPTLMSGKVSSTNISSTYVQLSSATTPQACSNSIVGAIRYSVGTIQVCNGVAWTSQTTGDNSDLFAVLADQKSTGTHGGSYTANNWVTRDLNTKLYDSIGITVSSNQFTLPAGTYLIDAAVQAYKTGASQALLYNVTDAAASLNGTAVLASNSSNGHATSVLRGVLVLGSAKTFEIRWRGSDSQATTGLGFAANIAGYPETYMNVLITKLNSGGGGDGGNGVSAFNDLTDVNTAGAVAGSYIRYDGSTWVVSTTYDIATPDADRITSGTLAMVANTSGNYVSLTTGGTTWGYFGQSASYLPTLLTVGGNVSVTGGISVTGNVRAYSYLHLSDERLKDTITTIPNAADILTKLRGTHFRWKSSKQFSYGLIAQEVEKVVPDLVTNGEGLKAVDYDQLAPILLEGWKVHHKAIKALEDENAQLKAAMEGLEQRIRKLEAAGVAR